MLWAASSVFCYILYVLASAFVFLALALTWFGPWTHQATNLLFTKPYLIALNACAAISIFGLVVVLFRALFIRKTVKLTVATVEGGTISVTKDAISSQAAHIIEEDGTCLAHRVNVQISKNNSCRLYRLIFSLKSLLMSLQRALSSITLFSLVLLSCADLVFLASIFLSSSQVPSRQRMKKVRLCLSQKRLCQNQRL